MNRAELQERIREAREANLKAELDDENCNLPVFGKRPHSLKITQLNLGRIFSFKSTPMSAFQQGLPDYRRKR